MVKILREYAVDFWSVGSLPLGIILNLVLLGFPRALDASTAIARLIELAEGGLRSALIRRRGGPRAEVAAGFALVGLVVGLVGSLAWFAVVVLDSTSGPTRLVGRSLLIAWGLSIGRLASEASRASRGTDLATARRSALDLVGLDATRLDPSGLRQAQIRRLGERATSDVIAPLFWLAVGGPAGLWAYRAAEALGRRFEGANPRTRPFGLAPSKLREAVDFLPDRLGLFLIALSATLLAEDGMGSLRTGLDRGRKPPSRPGARGSGAIEGALGLQPGGELERASVEPKQVRRAWRILILAGLHAAALAVAYRLIVVGD